MKKLVENYLQDLNESKKNNSITDKIIEFFQKNPNPDDHEVHNFAEEQGMEADDLEEKIYALLSSLINLKGSEIPDEKFDSKELAMGIEVEKEHHDNIMIRKAIAKAHLLENLKYYTVLLKAKL